MNKNTWNLANYGTRVVLLERVGFNSYMGRELALLKWDKLSPFVQDSLMVAPQSDLGDTISQALA